MKRKVLITALVLAASVPLSSEASGFSVIEQSASGMGASFAGSAAHAEDASIQFFNPAGLALLDAPQASLAAHAIDLNMRFANGASGLPAAGLGALPVGATRADAGDVLFVPNLFAALPLRERFVVGLSVTAPFGLKTEYDDPWIGRFQGIRSELKSRNVSPALSFAATPAIALGVALDYQTLDANLGNAVLLGAATEGRARLDGDDSGWGWHAGVLLTPSDGTHIGLGYRSHIAYTLAGTLTVSTLAGNVVPAATGPVTAELTVPDSAYLSFARQLGRWTLLADVSYTRWSAIQALTVRGASGAVRDNLEFGFDDTWRYALGAVRQLDQHWKLRVGAAFDQSPVSDALRTVRLPDSDRIWLSAGAQWQRGRFGVDAGYAHLLVDDARIDLSRAQSGAPASFGSRVNGVYESTVDIASLQITYKLR